MSQWVQFIRSPKFSPWVLLVIFLLSQFYFEGWIDSLGQYAAYGFELGFVAVVWAFLGRPSWVGWNRLQVMDLAAAVGMLALGALSYRAAALLGLPIPFDLSQREMVFLLVAFGPVLEELVFRGALWGLLERVLMQKRWALLMTSVIFSLAHLRAYFYVPEEFQAFVLYQSVYTLGLGFLWGYLYLRRGALILSTILHAGFNLGFHLMSRV